VLNLAFAVGPFSVGDNNLYVLDLVKGATLRQFKMNIAHARVTPDGKYLFAQDFAKMRGYSVQGTELFNPNYSNPSTARPPPRCIRPFLTELRPGPASETQRPLTPTWGRHRNGLFSGSTGGVRNGNREGVTQALAHAAIPLQVWPA
jgi:hypothetical protein